MTNNHDSEETVQVRQDNWPKEDREFQKLMMATELGKAFTTPQGVDNIRLIMTPGEDTSSLFMRADIPNNKMALAFSVREKRCREHEDGDGLIHVKKMLCALTSVKAKRANLASNTIIGNHTFNEQKRGVGAWLRRAAGMEREDDGPEGKRP